MGNESAQSFPPWFFDIKVPPGSGQLARRSAAEANTDQAAAGNLCNERGRAVLVEPEEVGLQRRFQPEVDRTLQVDRRADTGVDVCGADRPRRRPTGGLVRLTEHAAGDA